MDNEVRLPRHFWQLQPKECELFNIFIINGHVLLETKIYVCEYVNILARIAVGADYAV